MQEDCVVGEVKITSMDVGQHTFGVLISYLREG